MSLDCVIACNHRTGSAGTLAHGDVAQLGEHGLCKPGVGGSSPLVSTLYLCCRELLQLAIRLGFRHLQIARSVLRLGGGGRSNYFFEYLLRWRLTVLVPVAKITPSRTAGQACWY